MAPIQLRAPVAAIYILLAAVLCLLAEATAAKEIVGRMVGINDGDTLTLLTERHAEVRIRLAEIDTPERRQPYGTRACPLVGPDFR